MRIAVNATILDERPGGLGVYTAYIIKELAELGAELRVFTSAPATVGVVPIRRVPKTVRPSRGALGHLARISWSQAIFPTRAKREKADVSFITTPTEGATMPRIPQVVTVHDLLPLKFPDEFPRIGVFFRKVLPGILNNSTAIIVPSESTKKDCVEAYGLEPAKMFVVPEGFAAEFSPNSPEPAIARVKARWGIENYFLYVGSILPHKNIAGMLEAYALASKKTANPLVIVGRKDPRFYPALARKAASLGIIDRVKFLDYVPFDTLHDLYRAATAFVFPSFYEGFGLPILESMASGLPVISSNSSSMPEVAGDAACLFDPADRKACADAMIRIATDKKWHAELKAKGLLWMRQFSWDKAGKATLAVLEGAAKMGKS